ncbi:MAG: hypothetical protein AAFV45_06080 [Pseudomonadota bacterium]
MQLRAPSMWTACVGVASVCAMLPLASPVVAGITRATDHATSAFLAQRDGDYASCAKHADKARRQTGANYTLHRLYAACTVNAADEARKDIGDTAYADRLTEAVDALQLLRSTPGAYHQPKADNVINLTIKDLEARIISARKSANPTN